MSDSLAEFYYEKITTSDNPIPHLVNFMKSLLDIEDSTPLYPMIARLYKIYGKEVVFFSLLDCVDVPNLNKEKMYGLIAFFCKKRLENKFTKNSARDLTKFSEEVLKQMGKNTRTKPRNPFGDLNG